MEKTFSIHLCNYIRIQGAKKFASQLAFADACGVSEKLIRNVYNGTHNFQIDNFEKIACGLDESMSYILIQINY